MLKLLFLFSVALFVLVSFSGCDDNDKTVRETPCATAALENICFGIVYS